MKEVWWVSPEVRGPLEARAPLDVARWMHVAETGSVLSSDRQSVAALLDGDPPLLIKWRRTRKGRGRRTLLRASRERREARAYLQLGALGIRAPMPWAVGERRRSGLLVGAVLVRRFRTGFAEARTTPERLASLGTLLRRWHDLGFRHGDCYPKNVLLPTDGGEPMPIGCPAATFVSAGARLDRDRRKDLSQWAAGLFELDPACDPFAFLASYAEAPGLPGVGHLRTWLQPTFGRIQAKKQQRRETQAEREAEGPLRPRPLALDGGHPPPVKEHAIARLVSGGAG